VIDHPRDMVLPVDKPSGPTSHDIVDLARREIGTRRVGHTGTLDPFASGLLLLCVGRATRVAEYLTALDKTYQATMRLGRTTDTLDREGRVVREREGWAALGPEEIVAALERLTGEIDQVPPQYSAKKVDGEAMHRRARRGERVELESRRVTVHELALAALELPLLGVRVRCSSGTYVRSLARDVGEALGVGAHLTDLRRTAIGGFDVERALPPEALGDRARVAASAISPLASLAHLPSLQVGEEAARRLGQGQAVALADAEAGGTLPLPRGSALPVPGAAAERAPGVESPVVVACAGQIVAIAEARGGLLHPKKVFHG